MTLEVLGGIESIGGLNVVVMDNLRERFPEKFNESGAMDYTWFEADIRPYNHIYLRHDVNSLSFTFRKDDKPGCGINTLISAAKIMLERINTQSPSRENSMAITKLDESLMWIDKLIKGT